MRLKSAPKDSIRLEIIDSSGTVIHTQRVIARAGLNRLTWDLRHDGPKQVELRTTPPDNPNIWQEARIRDAMNESVEIINKLEVMRRQIEDTLKVRGGDAALAEQLKALDQKMLDVELMQLSKTDLHSDDKWYVEKYKIYMNLIWLSGEVGTGAGDVAGGAEFRPTDASMATLVELERDLAGARLAYQKLLETDVKAFNELMGARMKVIMH